MTATVLAGAATALPGHAAAQNINQYFLDSPIPFDVSRGNNVSVLDRPRPDYEAAGVRLGSFLAYPQVKGGAGYTDNVFGQQRGGVDDAFFTIDPKISVASDWSRHALTADAGGKLKRYASYGDKDENGWFADGTGRIDIGDSAIETTARIRKGYQTQASGTFPVNSRQSVPFLQSTLEARGTYQGARFRLIGFADTNRINFDDVRALDGSVIDQDVRDQRVSRGSGRVEFAATPAAAAFAQVTYTATSYDDRNAIGGFGNRDSREWAAIGGATFDLTALMRGTVGVGYIDRNYKNAVYPKLSGPTFDVRVDYFLTQLTTLTLEAQRNIEDSVSQGITGTLTRASGGYFVNQVKLRADHELLRNLILHAYGGYETNDFKGVSRFDKIWNAGTGADYFVNRRVGLGTTLDYIDRHSRGTPIGQPYNEFRATVSMLYQI